MVNRYWRSYPWILQMVLLILMVFTLFFFSLYLALLIVPRTMGVSYTDLSHIDALSTSGAMRAGLVTQGIEHAGIFLIPATVFAAFSHPRIREYLGLRLPGKAIHWFLVTGIMVGLVPVFTWGEAWTMANMHLGATADKLQKMNDEIISAYLRLNTTGDLVLLLGVLALLPAIGEELMFRGVMLRMFHGRSRKALPRVTVADVTLEPDVQRTMVFPVVMTALLFAAIHFNAYGFVFIFIAGCVLALIYFLTGSILCSMWAHLLYNGSQVLLEFLSHRNKGLDRVIHGQTIPATYVLCGLLLFVVSFYGLVKMQTPMSADWSDNFRGEEASV